MSQRPILASASKRGRRVPDVTPGRRRKKVYEYALKRLKEEVAAGPRGTKARLSESIGISTAHMTNLTTRTGERAIRGLGEEVLDKLAAHWGMTLSQMEDIAMGKPVSGIRPALPDPPFLALLARIAEQAELHAELFKTGSKWRVSTVVRAAATIFENPGASPREGWEKILNAIESGEIDEMSGGVQDANAAAKKQTGRRVKLPKPSTKPKLLPPKPPPDPDEDE